MASTTPFSDAEIREKIEATREVVAGFVAKFQDYNNITAFHNDLIKNRFNFVYPAETERMVHIFRKYLLERVRTTKEYMVEHKGVVEGLDKEALHDYKIRGFIPNDDELWELAEAEFPSDTHDDGCLRGRIKLFEKRILHWEPAGWSAGR